MVEQVLKGYAVLQAAQGSARTLTELELRRVDGELARRGVEPGCRISLPGIPGPAHQYENGLQSIGGNSMSSTFGSLTTVKLGIYAAQKGLDVTGNNITNINTNGLHPPAPGPGQSDLRRFRPLPLPVQRAGGAGVLVNGVSRSGTRDWTSPTGSPRPMWARGFMARRPGEAGRYPG